jgi:hypothetical protein
MKQGPQVDGRSFGSSDAPRAIGRAPDCRPCQVPGPDRARLRSSGRTERVRQTGVYSAQLQMKTPGGLGRMAMLRRGSPRCSVTSTMQPIRGLSIGLSGTAAEKVSRFTVDLAARKGHGAEPLRAVPRCLGRRAKLLRACPQISKEAADRDARVRAGRQRKGGPSVPSASPSASLQHDSLLPHVLPETWSIVEEGRTRAMGALVRSHCLQRLQVVHKIVARQHPHDSLAIHHR